MNALFFAFGVPIFLIRTEASGQGEMMIGIEFKNYTNYHGALANGQCCDDATKSEPHCPQDLCDTAFQPCGTTMNSTGGMNKPCDVFPSSLYATTYNNNSFILGKILGNSQNTSGTLIVFRFPYTQLTINFTISAYEMPESGMNESKSLIASWTFLIDWMDLYYSDPPSWKKYLLRDDQAELGVWAFSQCARRNYGPTCSIFCKPTIRFTCLNNGTINCTEGWTGVNCSQMVDHCVSHKCQHASTCKNALTNYSCACPPHFTGTLCETDLRISTTTAPPTATGARNNSTDSQTTDAENTTDVAPIVVGVVVSVLFLADGAVIIYFVINRHKQIAVV